jgi:cell wall assembly regulator SMI1
LALTKVTMHDGSRPLRKPRAANDLAIAAAEERLGVTLPEGLKRIYRVKDGGSTRGVMVPLVANPRPVFDDWDTAFGGYDDLHALDRLRTVHDAFLDFTDEDDAEAFPEGSKQLVVLAQWYLETTFLDYRAEGEPRVGMVDFENEDWTESARWFDDFDHFMAALRRVDMEHGRTPSPRVLRDEAPSPSQPDRFWGAEGPGVADHGADDARWTTASIRLGVALPEAFRPYLAAVNGGRPRFTVLPGRPGDWRQEEALDPFMGGPLLGVDQWVSLRLLSDRLVFTPGFPPWADTWQGADRLVVMAGSHDSVLMLDYRRGDDPEVLFVADLDDPSSGLDLGTPESFLAALRSFEGVPVIEDRRLSARAPAPETFWLDGEAPGLAAEALAAVEGRLGLSLPERLKTWMGRRNGGAVRFRYLPPVMETADGRLRIKTSETWEDIFPDGVAPAGDWVRLVDWMARRGEDPTPALRGLDHSQFVTAEMGEPSRVIVLAEGPERLTLLDMSRTTSAENGSLVQLRKGSQGWERIHRSGFFRGLSPRAARDTL